ncbi:hypothetical protein BJ878DRAFT_153647 [Calycina marina]|uniref:Uncharacterized protein n=1 Tax=Calycina marina TaxID=1763456 RepID=A0A9P7Z985_9HELO|nr:hypothetical protein BJ878DRAFT_153647 [Calycina marina]
MPVNVRGNWMNYPSNSKNTNTTVSVQLSGAAPPACPGDYSPCRAVTEALIPAIHSWDAILPRSPHRNSVHYQPREECCRATLSQIPPPQHQLLQRLRMQQLVPPTLAFKLMHESIYFHLGKSALRPHRGQVLGTRVAARGAGAAGRLAARLWCSGVGAGALEQEERDHLTECKEYEWRQCDKGFGKSRWVALRAEVEGLNGEQDMRALQRRGTELKLRRVAVEFDKLDAINGGLLDY